MEEASIAAVNGELSPFTTGVTACRMIAACRDLTDYRRASEWIEATEKYCQRQSVSGFPGVCRIHRAEVAAVGGAWERAEQELERATTELDDYNAAPPQADGFYAIGDIRRLRGDFEGAEAALREAHARGRIAAAGPRPDPARRGQGQGRGQRDQRGRRRARAGTAGPGRGSSRRRSRSRSRPATWRGHGRPSTSSRRDRRGYPSPALEAGRQVALGRVLLAEGDAAGAARELRAAIRGWREVGAPYEVARARRVLARALRALDDEEDADLELRAALDEFQRLGARVDAAAAERELRAAEDRRSGPVQVRQTFMFTDIVGSTNLAEALGDEAWERLLRWHDDTLRGLVASGGGEIVNSTGDGFFVAFDSARQGIDCAIVDPAGPARPPRQHRLRAARSGSASTPPRPTGAAPTTAAWASTSRRGSPRSPGEARSWPPPRRSPRPATSPRPTPGEAPVKGVTAPVSLASIAWT